MGMKLVALAVVMLLGGVAHADGPRPRGELRQVLLQHFDRNHDGRLEGRERKQAARALHRLAKRLARADDRRGPDGRGGRRARLMQRYDRNRDGNVGPREMPPGLADELRPLDRDGDGWLDNNELR
jgi:Ca2+-binding EF-hand superfamily protein